jgi:geranylgeranylglycerol-phosphate geranylgeranyltransferase
MKFIVYFFYIINLCLTPIHGLITTSTSISKYNKTPIFKNTCITHEMRKKKFNPNFYEKPIFPTNPIQCVENKIKQKMKSIAKIIRIECTFPTLLLCFTGGWITTPSLYSLLTSPAFIISSINTILVMYVSMILNDIFDLEVDKYNNPARPLVTGEIKVKEAIGYASILTIAIEYSAYMWLPSVQQKYLHLALLNVLLYTPYLKKIMILKNVSCAYLVAFSLYFAGLGSSSGKIINNINLLEISSRLVFFGSFTNELLLDMRDKYGDKINKITTIPVKYGNRISWRIALSLLFTNIMWNAFEILKIYGLIKSVLFIMLCSPFYTNMLKIKQNSYSKSMILYFLEESTKNMLVILIYLCSLVNV